MINNLFSFIFLQRYFLPGWRLPAAEALKAAPSEFSDHYSWKNRNKILLFLFHREYRDHQSSWTGYAFAGCHLYRVLLNQAIR